MYDSAGVLAFYLGVPCRVALGLYRESPGARPREGAAWVGTREIICLRRKDRVHVNDHTRTWLVNHSVTVDVTSSALGANRWQSAFNFVRKWLDLLLPARWEVTRSIVFFLKSGRQPSWTIIVADRSDVLLAETGLAVSAMAPSIIIIVAMLPMFLFLGVMILRPGLLWRKSYKSSYDHERQCSHSVPPLKCTRSENIWLLQTAA